MKKYIAMLLAVLTLTCGACGALAEALTEPATPQEPEVETVVLATEEEETAAPAEEVPAEGETPLEEDPALTVETVETVETQPAEAETENETAAPVPFTGKVEVERKALTAIHDGDEVRLNVKAQNTNKDYTILWETVKTGTESWAEWKKVGSDKEYVFIASEDTAKLSYRVTLKAEDGTELVSDIWTFTITAETEETIETEEPAETEEPIETEEPAETEQPAEEKKAETPKAEPVEVIEIEDMESPLWNGEPTTVTLGEETSIALREQADGMSPISSDLTEGAEITVVEIEGDWVKVESGEETGYIYKDDIASAIGYVEEEKEPSENPEDDMKVTIFTSRRSVMTLGETVTLTSKLEGFEDYEILYQWECDKGEGFQVVPNAHGETFEFEASNETMSYDWRLQVYYR